MAKISRGDLSIADGWMQFFERIGWQYESCDTVSGVGFYSTGVIKTTKDDPKGKLVVKPMTSVERHSIEDTWREQDKPALKEVSNG